MLVGDEEFGKSARTAVHTTKGMGGAVSSRRATASNFPLQDWGREKTDWRMRLVVDESRFEAASRVEQK
ncbi:unnamed protein product, partial [Ectocarpus sp. 12 AP-2014]